MGEVLVPFHVRCHICRKSEKVFATDYQNAKEVAEQIGTGWRQHHHYTEESATGFEVMVCPDHTDEQAFNWYERRMMRLALEY